MNDNVKYSIVYTTTDSSESAENLAEILLKEKKAACIQISKIDSRYRWKGKMCKEPEYLLNIKTKISEFNKIKELIKSNHPYENPEIIQIPIIDGISEYLNWISENIKYYKNLFKNRKSLMVF